MRKQFVNPNRPNRLTWWMWRSGKVAALVCLAWYLIVMGTGLAAPQFAYPVGNALAAVCLITVVVGIAEVCRERARYD